MEWTHALVEAGDCLFIPAFHIHYVRSWGRNVAFSYMWQTRERLATHASTTTSAADNEQLGKLTPENRDEVGWLSLAEAELLWDYPNPDQLNGDSCRMGFPDWRRELVLPLIDACTAAEGAEQLLDRSCVERWSSHFDQAARDTGILKAGLYKGLRHAADVENERGLMVQDLFRDGAAKLWRRIAVLMELV